MKRFWFILAALLGLGASAVPASAAVVYSLNCTNAACSSTSTTYGTVTLTQLGTGTVPDPFRVGVSVALAATYYFNTNYALLWSFNTGDGVTPTETIVKTGANAGNFTVQNSTAAGCTVAGGCNGEFAFNPFTTHASSCSGANSPSCFDYAVKHNSAPGTFTTAPFGDNTLSLDITKTGGLTLANFDDNSLGFTFAASITKCNFFNIAGTTFCGAASPFSVASRQVPEPATWLLFFAAMAGLTVLYRRRQLARA